MLITVDTVKDSPEQIRAACGLLLSLLGDLDSTISETVTEVAAPPPPPPSNVVAFPPPPPPPAPSAETGAASTSTAVASNSAAANGALTPALGAPPAAPAPPTATTPPATSVAASPSERDSAGMPWDARIHQKGKSKKKDGTWKLQKNIDQALVQQVVKELAGSVLAVGTAPSAAVSLPPTPTPPAASPVPVPAAAAAVPAPPAAVAVPAPPDAAVGGVPTGVTFRSLVDKIVEGTKSGKLTATKVQEICQQHGAPNLASLNTMQHLIEGVNTSIDVALIDVTT